MKWPSVRFFQAIGLGGFSLAIYNTINTKRVNSSNFNSITDLCKKIEGIDSKLEQIVQSQNEAKDKKVLIDKLVETFRNYLNSSQDLKNNVNITKQNITDIELMKKNLSDYYKSKSSLNLKGDQNKLDQINQEIEKLNNLIDSKIESINDSLNNISPHVNDLNSKILKTVEEFNKLKQNSQGSKGNQKFMDDIPQIFENINN